MSSAQRVPSRRRQLPPRPIDYVIAGELGVEPDPDTHPPALQKRGRPAKIRRDLVLLFYGRLLWLLGDPPSGRRGGYGLPPGQPAPRPRNKPYDVAKTLTVLRKQWRSWEEDGQLTPCRSFPAAELEGDLAARVSPQDIAHIVLVAWFGVVDDDEGKGASTVHRYITRFRQTLPLAVRIALGI
jgi:hypothetical protein